MYAFMMWEETGVPGENPRRHGEDIQTPQGPSEYSCTLPTCRPYTYTTKTICTDKFQM
jgi:hypothetical protein